MVRKLKSEYLPVVIVGASLTALLVLAVFLVNRESSGAVASDAQAAILSESTLSAAAGVRNATSFAVVFAESGATNELIDDARDGAVAAAEELRTRVDRLLAELPNEERVAVSEAHVKFKVATDWVLAGLGAGDSSTRLETLQSQGAAYDDLSATLTEVRDIRTGEIIVAGEGVGRAADAVRFLVMFLLPLGIMIGVWRTIRRSSERRILTEELRHEREVSHSKDSFIADVSHELRTPLTGIYGFASTLEDGDETMSESSRELVGLIVTEAAELARMVDDLVAAGRIDANSITYNLETVELSAEIEEVVRPFKRRGVSVEVDDIGISVLADRLRLRQLLRNLVSNAVKYGGDEIAVTAYSEGGTVKIEVIDDGPGVAPDVDDRLFNRYVHEHGTALLQGSVGLGLAIARSFAEGMNGSLDYKRVDDLTIFEVSLPVAGIEEATPDDPEPTAVEAEDLEVAQTV
ncbi:MAG TPA: HAMP domain-containing sensor histidine kinase [Acidimicrobiia bacterium]|nr:HAMP domain-containing sensor histidine kinase [Acidimicrobiia bacterium]